MKIFVSAVFIFLFAFQSCKERAANTSPDLVSGMQLKTGQLVSCGPVGQFGSAEFEISCGPKLKEDFDLAIKLLHSFEYDEAEKVFAKIIGQEPSCAMAYWGVAMANFHPLWTPPTEAELKKGARAIAIADSLDKTARESDYINAIAAFYKDWNTVNHRTRTLAFEKAMEQLQAKYPADMEANIFYSLATIAAVDPADTSFARQKKAGKILEQLYKEYRGHPGIAHYLIHAYDYPRIAQSGLEVARRYAAIAPSSAHALHMPSHIFTRLGLWDEAIASNTASVASAKCYAEAAGIKGHWDEELHGIDYLVYAFLQQGRNDSAKKQWDYLNTIQLAYPVNFKVAYAFAAIPSRYLLENKKWKEAAALQVSQVDFPWEKFPWENSIIHFTRLLGAVHSDDINLARNELMEMKDRQNILLEQKDNYKANQVAIQIKTGEAWIALKEGKASQALSLMEEAARMEDQTQKHPVTPGEVLPARELLADMLLEMQHPAKALVQYEMVLEKQPNRFNALYGAGLSAQRSGNAQKAKQYFSQLSSLAGNSKTDRPELQESKKYLDAIASW